jgi:hypothetical protein
MVPVSGIPESKDNHSWQIKELELVVWEEVQKWCPPSARIIEKYENNATSKRQNAESKQAYLHWSQ